MTQERWPVTFRLMFAVLVVTLLCAVFAWRHAVREKEFYSVDNTETRPTSQRS